MDATVGPGFLTAGDGGTTEVAVTVGWSKDEVVPGSFVCDWAGFGGISGSIGPEGYSGAAPSGGTRDYFVTIGPAQAYGVFPGAISIFDFLENPIGSGGGGDLTVARGANPDVIFTVSQEPSFFNPGGAVDATAHIDIAWPGWTDPRGYATYILDWGDGSTPVTGSFTPADGASFTVPRGLLFGTYNVRLTVSSPGDQVYYDQTIVVVAAPPPPPPAPTTASLVVNPLSGEAPLGVVATYEVVAGDHTVTDISLDWGDGNVTGLAELSGTMPHTYASAGEFNATLSVTTDATTYGGWSHPDPEVVVGQVPDSYPNGDNAVERRDEHNTVTSKTNASAFYDLASRVNGWAANWDYTEGTITGNPDTRPNNALGVDYDRSSAFLVTAGYHLILTAILAPPAPSGIWEITTVNGEEIDRQDMVPAPVGETIYRDLLPPLISAPLGNTLLFETEARCDPRVDPLPPSDEVSFTVSWTLDVTWRPPMYRWIYPADPITASQLVDVTDPLLAPAGGASTDTAARGGFRVRMDPPLPDSTHLARRLGRPITLGDILIPQNSTSLIKSPHVIAGGRVMPPPALTASSKSMCRAVDWVVEPDLRGLNELGQLGAVARWIPDEGDFSGLTWSPHWGSGMSIALSTDYTPYVDPEYVYYARHAKQVTTPAVIFNGAGFARFAGSGLSGLEGFTVVLVATVHHPNNNSMADLVASPSTATDPSRATDCTLRYDNGYIRSHLGARTSSYRPSLFSHRGRVRPIIIVWAGGPRKGLLGIYDHVGGNGHWHEYANPNKPGYDARFWLGMNGAVQDQNYAQPMDVFDVSFYSHRMTLTEARRTAHKLDGVYGVTGR